jgi:hypothetical protein
MSKKTQKRRRHRYQWGDEGKGKIVDWLTDHARVWCASRAATTPATRWSSAA